MSTPLSSTHLGSPLSPLGSTQNTLGTPQPGALGAFGTGVAPANLPAAQGLGDLGDPSTTSTAMALDVAAPPTELPSLQGSLSQQRAGPYPGDGDRRHDEVMGEGTKGVKRARPEWVDLDDDPETSPPQDKSQKTNGADFEAMPEAQDSGTPLLLMDAQEQAALARREDAELRLATRLSLESVSTPPTNLPLAMTLAKIIDRPSWETPLKGNAIPRKDANGGNQDLRHVVAYETMQSAARAVLQHAKTDQDIRGFLTQAMAVIGAKATPSESTMAKELTKFIFNCRGNFFLGDADENQRAGSSTAALHHTEDDRVAALMEAKDEAEIQAVLNKAAQSLSGPPLNYALQMCELAPPQKPADTSDKTAMKLYKDAKKEMQAQLGERLQGSLRLLEEYRQEQDPGANELLLRLVKNEAAELLEGLADSTAYDASRVARPGLLDAQKNALPHAFRLFRAAEATGSADKLLEGLQLMKQVHDVAIGQADQVPLRKGSARTKPSFASSYAQ